MKEVQTQKYQKKEFFGMPLFALNEALLSEILDIYRGIAGSSPTCGKFFPPGLDYLKGKLLIGSPVVFGLGSSLEHGTGVRIERQIRGVSNEAIIRFELWPENGVIRYEAINDWRKDFKERTDKLFINRGIAIKIDQFRI